KDKLIGSDAGTLRLICVQQFRVWRSLDKQGNFYEVNQSRFRVIPSPGTYISLSMFTEGACFFTVTAAGGNGGSAVPGSRALNTQSLFPPSLPNDWKIARIARAYRAVLRSHQSTCLLCAPSINEAIGLLMNSVFISLCLAM
ncbi:unnamed protein product, partial [Mycena citricolor]